MAPSMGDGKALCGRRLKKGLTTPKSTPCPFIDQHFGALAQYRILLRTPRHKERLRLVLVYRQPRNGVRS